MITGQANCCKTFMLKPLEIIYNAFNNPANDKCAWVDADNAEVIILQDFRRSSELICWKDLMLLQKISLQLMFASKKTCKFLLRAEEKLNLLGSITCAAIEKQKWWMFGGKYLNFTTESHNKREKIIFLLLDILVDWLFLETLTDFICNIWLK